MSKNPSEISKAEKKAGAGRRSQYDTYDTMFSSHETCELTLVFFLYTCDIWYKQIVPFVSQGSMNNPKTWNPAAAWRLVGLQGSFGKNGRKTWNPCNRFCSNTIVFDQQSLHHNSAWLKITGHLPSLKQTILPENRPGPTGQRSYSNHPFSGAFAVSSREGTGISKTNQG